MMGFDGQDKYDEGQVGQDLGERRQVIPVSGTRLARLGGGGMWVGLMGWVDKQKTDGLTHPRPEQEGSTCLTATRAEAPGST